MRHHSLAAATLWAALSVAPAQAADFNFSGDPLAHNQVLQFDFSLAAPGADVRIWTDAWRSGLNFDPTAALWSLQGPEPAFALLLALGGLALWGVRARPAAHDRG